MWARTMSRWVTVHRHSGVGPAGGALRCGPTGPRRNGPWPVSPAAPGNERGSRGSGGGRLLHPRATRGQKCILRHNGYTKSHLFLLAIHAL